MMLLIRNGLVAVVAALMITGTQGCTDVQTDNSPQDDFLPVFSNGWKEVANQAHRFFLASADDGKPSGTFDGSESHPTLGTGEITGTFLHSTCQMTIGRSSGSVLYEGKFLHADTLRLTRGSEVLIVARDR